MFLGETKLLTGSTDVIEVPDSMGNQNQAFSDNFHFKKGFFVKNKLHTTFWTDQSLYQFKFCQFFAAVASLTSFQIPGLQILYTRYLIQTTKSFEKYFLQP